MSSVSDELLANVFGADELAEACSGESGVSSVYSCKCLCVCYVKAEWCV